MNTNTSNKGLIKFLKNIHKKSSRFVGEEYLKEIAKIIATELKVDYSMIGLCDLPISEDGYFNSLSFYGRGKLLKNLRYQLRGTPCIKVLEEGVKVYLNNVQEEFPRDVGLQKMEINSYISVPIQNVMNENIGLVTVMNEKDIPNPEFVTDVLDVLSASIESVIEKLEERKKLKEQESNFYRILECIGEGIVLTDLEDRISFVNSKFCQITGYSKEELIGRVAFEMLLDEGEKGNFQTKIENRKKGMSELYELQVKRKDNSCFWAEVYGSPYFDETGKLIGTIGSVKEITERIENKKLTETLYQISEKANTVTEINEFYEKIHSILGSLLNVDNFYIAVLDKENNVITYPYYVDEKDEKPEPAQLEGGLTEFILNTGNPLLVNRDKFIELAEKGVIKIVGSVAESWIGVPLKLANKTFGIISVQSYRSDLIYTEKDVEVLSFVAQNVSDVIAHKRDEELKKKKEEDYNFIFENSPIGIASTDLKGKIINVNASFCELLGYSQKELLTKKIKEITYSEDLEENLDLRKRILESDRNSFQQQKRYLRKDGKIVYALLVTFLVFDEENKPKNFTGFIVDISEIIQVKSRNEAILNAIPDMVFLCDKFGNFLDFKANKNELYLQPDDFLGKNIREIGLPQDVESVIWEKFSNVLSEKKPQKFEYSLQLSNKQKYYEARMSLSSQNEVMAIIRDITEKQKIEAEIQRMGKLESIGLLAGGIAHDFNNMLTGVTGNISLAKLYMEEENFKSIEKLEEAEKATIKAKQLTQQLLTFSKGGAPIKKVGSLSQTIKDSVGFALRGANISSEIEIAENLWSAEYDEGQIDQVLNNLIINASQSMPNGGKIKVSCQNVRITKDASLPIDEGSYVLIKVSDNGSGIPKKIQDKIFEPYFTTKEHGHGLGLATTYSIILKHDGFINFETKEGKGTTFFIYLPSLEELNEKYEQKSKKSKSEKNTDVLENKKILVMDDDDLVREVISNLFLTLGLKVFSASDGEEAIEIYKNSIKTKKHIDLVLTDLTVPGGMGGRDLIVELLKIDPSVKAIVISGYYNDPVMANFEDFGFKGVIQKPFEIEELLKEVKRILSE